MSNEYELRRRQPPGPDLHQGASCSRRCGPATSARRTRCGSATPSRLLPPQAHYRPVPRPDPGEAYDREPDFLYHAPQQAPRLGAGAGRCLMTAGLIVAEAFHRTATRRGHHLLAPRPGRGGPPSAWCSRVTPLSTRRCGFSCLVDVLPGGLLRRRGRPVPRARAGHRLSPAPIRSALPVRGHADRRLDFSDSFVRPSGSTAAAILLGLGFAGMLIFPIARTIAKPSPRRDSQTDGFNANVNSIAKLCSAPRVAVRRWFGAADRGRRRARWSVTASS